MESGSLVHLSTFLEEAFSIPELKELPLGERYEVDVDFSGPKSRVVTAIVRWLAQTRRLHEDHCWEVFTQHRPRWRKQIMVAQQACRRGDKTPSGGKLYRVPAPTKTFTGREDVIGVLAKKFRDSPTPMQIALTGPPGIGKSATVAMFAHQYAAQLFPAGVFWLYADGARVEQLRLLSIAADFSAEHHENPDAVAHRIRHLGSRALVIIDGVVTHLPVALYPGGTHLLISANSRQLGTVVDEHIPLGVLTSEETRALLERIVGAQLPVSEQLLDAVHGHPLTAELIAILLRIEPELTPDELIHEISAADGLLAMVAPNTPYQRTTAAVVQVHFQRLPANSQRAAVRFATLQRGRLPLPSLLIHKTGISTAERLQLQQRGLLQRDQNSYWMHGVIQAIVQNLDPDLREEAEEWREEFLSEIEEEIRDLRQALAESPAAEAILADAACPNCGEDRLLPNQGELVCLDCDSSTTPEALVLDHYALIHSYEAYEAVSKGGNETIGVCPWCQGLAYDTEDDQCGLCGHEEGFQEAYCSRCGCKLGIDELGESLCSYCEHMWSRIMRE